MKTKMTRRFRVTFKNGHIAIVYGPYFERAMVKGGYGSCGSAEVDYYEEYDDSKEKFVLCY